LYHPINIINNNNRQHCYSSNPLLYCVASPMASSRLALAPGPTAVRLSAINAYSSIDRSANTDLDGEFVQFYADTADQFKRLLHATDGEVVMMMGEAMLGLWGALTSTTQPNDRVISLANGMYGHGIGEMARAKGCNVTFVGAEHWERALTDDELQHQVLDAIAQQQPRLVTVVHCDTPTALLTPMSQLQRIGAACRQSSDEANTLLVVDMVSSFGSVDIDVSRCAIDIAIIGTQKALSCLPDVTVMYVSQRAWTVIEQRKYQGYDALLPWQHFRSQVPAFPYTMSWQSIASLGASLDELQREGIDNVYARHAQAAHFTRARIRELGLTLYMQNDAEASQSVTAVYGMIQAEWCT
jgi:aspartate aminotransferase-like enzyme